MDQLTDYMHIYNTGCKRLIGAFLSNLNTTFVLAIKLHILFSAKARNKLKCRRREADVEV